MKWSYKFTQVSLIFSQSILASSSLQIEKLTIFLQDVANRSFLKSNALYKTLDNQKLLAEKDAEIAKRINQALAMGNELYAANRKHTQETYLLKQQIKSLEEENTKLQEQLQSAQAYKYSNHTWKLVVVVFRITEFLSLVLVHQVSTSD